MSQPTDDFPAGDLPATAIVADIGGTNARFAVADLNTLQLSHLQSFSCDRYRSIAEAAAAFVADLDRAPRFAAIAVAAPVTGEAVDFTNSPWSFTRRELCRSMNLQGLLILNDFQALAMSLPYLAKDELKQIGGGDPVPRAPKVVVGPGTGLGAAGLVWSHAGWVAVPGEGGHINLAPAHPGHLPLLKRMLGERQHVSAERVISGPGLSDLYRCIALEAGQPGEAPAPSEIVARAVDKSDPLAVETLEHFIAWLGTFAGDAALFFGARGGVYLGGGIPVRILDFLQRGDFREAFEAKGRMRTLLSPIPLYVIAAHAPALKGAAAALRDSLQRGTGELTTGA